tara:strand:- start:643 stop:843 length:201 start_codon:yes stop_codon:yes gene_type:complete
MLEPGALVRHFEDENLSCFGLGVVTEVFSLSAACPWVAKVSWQRPINKILYPAELFTVDSLVVLNK